MPARQTIETFNREHNHSLYDFLAYYGGIPLSITNPKHSVEIVDLTASSITLNYIKDNRSRTTVVPFTPPLKSIDQAPVRLQLMAFEAADAFRVSPYRGNRYLYPDVGGMAVISSVVAGIVLSISPKTSYRLLMRRTPRFAQFVRDKLRRIVVVLLLVHAWEYATFLRPRLDKYRVYGLLRFRWFITCLFEGFPSWIRYFKYTDSLAKQRTDFERNN